VTSPPATVNPAHRRADALHERKDYAAAVVAYREAAAVSPGDPAIWFGLGAASKSLSEFGDAIAAFRRALDLAPNSPGVRCGYAEALFSLGQISQAIAEFEIAAQGDDLEARDIALSNVALLAPGDPALNNADILRVRRRWLDTVHGGIEALTPIARPPGDRLRIGFLSAFFGSPNWMKFVWGVINRHDRRRYEVNLLSDGDDPSAESGYADHDDDRIWQINGVPNHELAGHIARAGIDVLVNLDGYSFPKRLPLFRYRAAPRQIAWMGMYGTTGLDAFDWVVGDAQAVPVSEEPHYAERIARVPGSYLAFEVTHAAPDVVPPPCLETGVLTFGCLGSAYKITDQMVAAWARILAGAPDARLLLRNRALDMASNQAAMRDRFTAAGLPLDRITLEGGAAHGAFLRTYGRIDIALDTYPYNGGTTTAEAIWQGVPVLSFNGDRWASRTSRSILAAAGMADWVMPDEAAFVGTAIALARDPGTPARLAALRSGLRTRVAESAACDTATLCRALEALYETDPWDS